LRVQRGRRRHAYLARGLDQRAPWRGPHDAARRRAARDRIAAHAPADHPIGVHVLPSPRPDRDGLAVPGYHRPGQPPHRPHRVRRPNDLDRYRPQLKGGFAMLLKTGASFTDAYQDHAVTETAPGHATILSGRWPAHTGIIRNLAGVQDQAAPLIGVTGPGASPMRFRGTAFFDWLKAADPGARALSISGKDRGAILPLGRAKEHVYWYFGGFFTTSRYYADTLPTWVRVFNGQRVPFRAAGTQWTLFLSERDYP